MPCNDHPSDKATYTFTISVPIGTTAVANGALTDQHTARDTDVWVWQEDRPMATYLIQLLTGDYQVIESAGPNGVPLVSAVLRDDVATMQPFLDVTPQMMKYFEKFFGAYPLDRYGLAITDSFSGLAMETQERSLFSRLDFEDGQLGQSQQMYLSHELAHQWFGDAVSPAQWSDIWLNESFATYSEWLWADHIGAEGIESRAASELAFRAPGSSTDPSAGDLFGSNSYGGGAVVLHALRHTIGDEAFFELLSRWVAENNGESRVTADFVALAQEVAGTSLTDFFDTWLYADSPPTQFPNG
jgi:aminopeptidase N